ncbi:MAG: AAA family ATPase [Bryobacteraceae bacterium]
MPDQRVVVLVGLPASGKSTWVAERGGVAISSDELRRWLRDDAADQSIHGVVFRLMREFVRLRITLGAPVTYVDATNLTRKHRRPFVKIAEHMGCICEAVFFDVSVDVCVSRNEQRDRKVPAAAIRAMAERLQAPSENEGFANVTLVYAQPPDSRSRSAGMNAPPPGGTISG